MKKLALMVLVLILLLLSGFAAAEDITEGYLLEAKSFGALADRFQNLSFAGEMKSVTLSDTQGMIFDPNPVDFLLPNFSVVVTPRTEITARADVMAEIVGSMIETARFVQESFPDVFAFNEEKAAPYMEAGMNYAIAEPALWVWTERAEDVMFPMFFYEGGDDVIPIDACLVVIRQQADGSTAFSLYSTPEFVVDYFACVEVNSGASPFQKGLVYWYLEKQAEANPPTGAPSNPKSNPGIGTLKIIRKGNIRVENDIKSKVLDVARKGETYVLLSIEENGWYQIQCLDDQVGFISPSLAEMLD